MLLSTFYTANTSGLETLQATMYVYILTVYHNNLTCIKKNWMHNFYRRNQFLFTRIHAAYFGQYDNHQTFKTLKYINVCYWTACHNGSIAGSPLLLKLFWDGLNMSSAFYKSSLLVVTEWSARCSERDCRPWYKYLALRFVPLWKTQTPLLLAHCDVFLVTWQ
jgi:hypothetical protein